MKNDTNRTIVKVFGVGASALIAIFAGMFGLLSISALTMSIIEKDPLSVIASMVCAFLCWVCWSVRKDVLL